MAAWTSIPRTLLALLATQNPLNPHVARSSNYFALRPRWPAQARRGRVIITVEKDRPGYVRGRTDEGRVGQLVLSAARKASAQVAACLTFRRHFSLTGASWGERSCRCLMR